MRRDFSSSLPQQLRLVASPRTPGGILHRNCSTVGTSDLAVVIQ
jgi:hypothetical protein